MFNIPDDFHEYMLDKPEDLEVFMENFFNEMAGLGLIAISVKLHPSIWWRFIASRSRDNRFLVDTAGDNQSIWGVPIRFTLDVDPWKGMVELAGDDDAVHRTFQLNFRTFLKRVEASDDSK